LLCEALADTEDLLCETLADTEDVAVGDDLLPEADEDAVGDAAAGYKLRPHSEDVALVVAAVDDALGSHHDTLEAVSVVGSIAAASTAADEDAGSQPVAVGSKRNAAAARHDRSNDAAEAGPKGKRRYW